MTWSNIWAGKNTKYQDILSRLDDSLSSSSSVVIHSSYEPTQSQWENAYLDQVGQALPIKPGCKLMWYDVRNGRMQLFTTAFDSDDTSNTSGVVFRSVDNPDRGDTISHIGNIRGNGYLSNTVFKGNTLHSNFMLDRTSFGRQGITIFKGFVDYSRDDSLGSSNLSNLNVYFSLDTDNPYNVTPSPELDMRGWNINLVSIGGATPPIQSIGGVEDVDISTAMPLLSNNTYGGVVSIMFTVILSFDERQGSKWMGAYGRVNMSHGGDSTSSSYFGMMRRSGYTFGEKMRIFSSDGVEEVSSYRSSGAIIVTGSNGEFIGKEFLDG